MLSLVTCAATVVLQHAKSPDTFELDSLANPEKSYSYLNREENVRLDQRRVKFHHQFRCCRNWDTHLYFPYFI